MGEALPTCDKRNVIFCRSRESMGCSPKATKVEALGDQRRPKLAIEHNRNNTDGCAVERN